MPTVGIVSALSFEARTLSPKKLRRNRVIPLGPGLLLVWSGMNARATGEAAEILAAHGCDLLLSWGVAGALAPGLRRGDLVLPTHVLGADGTRHHPDYDFGKSFARLLPASVHRHRGPIAEADRPVADPSEKHALGGRTGAVAVDMESAAIARIALRHGIGFHAVRVIIDEVDTVLPSFVVDQNSPPPRGAWRILPAPLRRPGEIPQLLPLMRGYLAARRSLKTLAGVLRAAAQPPSSPNGSSS